MNTKCVQFLKFYSIKLKEKKKIAENCMRSFVWGYFPDFEENFPFFKKNFPFFMKNFSFFKKNLILSIFFIEEFDIFKMLTFHRF